MLKFWELAPSPNNTKVRMALRFKGIEFEVVPVDPINRQPLIDVSGQDGTPVIEDRGIVLPESEGILAYLEANYRDKPALFPADKIGRRECNQWKQRLDDKVARHWAPVFFHAIGLRDALDEGARASFGESLRWLEDELGEKESFGGTDRPIDDLRVAEWVSYALPSAGIVERVPVFGKTKELFGVEPGRFPKVEKLIAPWNERLQ